MGNIAPPIGEMYRIVLELKGSKALTQAQYEKYKKAITDIAKAYGAKVATREHVIVEKKGRR
jgi:uncharacterized protein (DUF1330 family)